MGKIKSKLIKKTARSLIEKGVKFNTDFEKNKRILEGISSSKKVRNQFAGYAVKLKKQEMEKEK